MKPYPQRRSPRLQGYDYSQSGAYFVTICTYRRVHLFGQVRDGKIVLSVAGEMAFATWQAIPDHYPAVDLDAFVVMPNHVHGILVLVGTTHASSAGDNVSTSQLPTLGNVIGSYKSAVTRAIRLSQPGLIVWQGRYHDHIIRSESSLNSIRAYVQNNPALWEEDTFYGA